MEITLQGYHLPGPETKAPFHQDDYLTPYTPLNGVGPRWHITWKGVVRRRIWRPLNVLWPLFRHRPSLIQNRMTSRA